MIGKIVSHYRIVDKIGQGGMGVLCTGLQCLVSSPTLYGESKIRPMWSAAKHNFILQQGFEKPAPVSCSLQYSALQFQPRVVLIWILTGILFQRPAVFAILAAVLWWSALLPKLNPFDALYNRIFGKRPDGIRVSPAPPPRRTAQAMAGIFSLACALFVHFGFSAAAYVVEGIFLAAVLALTLGGFCLGSFVYHLFRGHGKFARRTLPWSGTGGSISLGPG
jgi:hypothetical protein